MANERILVVEDEGTVAEVVGRYLERDGFKVRRVADGARVMQAVSEFRPDLVILDVMLPNRNGLDICRDLRANGSTPVILLTARGEESDKILGLGLGADDYVSKPFSPGELVARIESVLRRTARASAGPAPLRIDERLQIDFPEHQVLVDGQPIDLKPTEASLLRVLVERADQVVPLEAILTEVWGPAYVDSPHYVHLYVNYLRRKIEPDPRAPRYILTQRGIGYRFAMPVPASSRRRAARAEGAATR